MNGTCSTIRYVTYRTHDGLLGAEPARTAWFPEGRHRREITVAAKTICDACPMRLYCLQLALEAREQHGVWASYDFGDADDANRARREARRRGIRIAKKSAARTPIQHGTNAGYQRHYDRGETACGECKEARAAWMADYRSRKGQAA